MAKTVKEMIDEIKKMQKENLVNNLDIVFLQILQAYENELAEKDKEIKDLEKEWEKLVCEKYDLQQTQLYKEDFIVSDFCINCRSELFYIDNIKKIKVNKNEKCSTCGWDKIIQLKDNSKYELLPSKDVK